MTSSQRLDEANGNGTTRNGLRMLSFGVDERIEIARRLTEAKYLVSNESAANFDRFERRVRDDEWDVIFVDARRPFDSVTRALDLIRRLAVDVPTFAVVDPHQQNRPSLLELGIADLFSPDDFQRLPGVVTHELELRDVRRMALEARLLKDQIKSAGDERTVLAAIGQLVLSSLDIGQVYDELVEQLKIVIPLDTAAIAVADIENDSITIEYVAGRALPGFEKGQVMPMSGFTVASQLARFVLVLDSDTLEDLRPEFPGIANLLEVGVRSVLAVPLIHRNEVVGFLATATASPDAYGPEHVEIAEKISLQISGALANTRLHASITRVATVREILVQLGREAGGARDLHSLYVSVFANIRKLLPIDRGVVALTGKDGRSLVIEHVDGQEIDGLGVGDSVELTDSSISVLSRSHLVTIDNAEEQMPFDPTAGKVAEAGFPSSIRTPLRARDSVIGLITVSAVHERGYVPGNLQFLERVADQIAPVIESLNLLERVQALATAVETTLDLVAITDLRGVTSYLNPAGIRMLGLAEGDTGVGISLEEFVAPEVANAVRQAGFAKATDTGGWQTEISLTPRNASEPIPVELLLVPVRN
ncbi:MAG: GAF domain-containing protein [Chloroflexi bacterium]|nr:GAF domain-containing protein [Chloroflexota bacterium]